MKYAYNKEIKEMLGVRLSLSRHQTVLTDICFEDLHYDQLTNQTIVSVGKHAPALDYSAPRPAFV